LDLDSDGDGCPDAAEANTVNVLANNTVAGPYGSNGFADRLEVAPEQTYDAEGNPEPIDTTAFELAYTLYYGDVIDSAVVVCANDFDGDGVGDLHDLDDDNDGVPDVIENVCAHALEVDKSTVTISTEITSSPNAISTLLDESEGNGHRFSNAQPIAGKALFEFDFGSEVLMLSLIHISEPTRPY